MPAPILSGAAAASGPLLRNHARRNLARRSRAPRRAQFHARVVRTDVQDEDGRKVYVLKLLSEDGRVITVRIDAATGRIR